MIVNIGTDFQICISITDSLQLPAILSHKSSFKPLANFALKV